MSLKFYVVPFDLSTTWLKRVSFQLSVMDDSLSFESKTFWNTSKHVSQKKVCLVKAGNINNPRDLQEQNLEVIFENRAEKKWIPDRSTPSL